MKARRLIESSTFEPETLQIIFKGFDEAWSEISHHFDDTTVEQARLRLAHAVMVVAREGSDDPERVRNDALQAMALALQKRN